MLEILNKIHQNMIQVLIFILTIFGCWTFKLNNTSKVLESRIFQLWNRILVVFLTISLIFMVCSSFKIMINRFRDTFPFLIAVNNIIFMSFIIFVYSFICFKTEKLKEILNEVLDLSCEHFEIESNLKLFSILITFEAFLIQPWDLINSVIGCFRSSFTFFSENFFIHEVFVFIFPVRIFVLLSCMLLKFHSLLLQNVAENDFKVEKLAKILMLTKKICKLFSSIVFYDIFVEFVFLNGMCYGLFTIIIDRIRGLSDNLDGLEYIVYHLTIVVFNLYIIVNSCNNVKRKVSKAKVKNMNFKNSF